MAQQVKVLVVKLDSLGAITGPMLLKEKINSPQNCPLNSMCK